MPSAGHEAGGVAEAPLCSPEEYAKAVLQMKKVRADSWCANETEVITVAAGVKAGATAGMRVYMRHARHAAGLRVAPSGSPASDARRAVCQFSVRQNEEVITVRDSTVLTANHANRASSCPVARLEAAVFAVQQGRPPQRFKQRCYQTAWHTVRTMVW